MEVNEADQKQSLRDKLQKLGAQTGSVTFQLDPSISPAQAKKLANMVTMRASHELGRRPASLKPYPNLSSFLVEGDREMLIRIANQDEVQGGFITGSAAKSEPDLIKPVRKYPTTRESWAKPEPARPDDKKPASKPRK